MNGFVLLFIAFANGKPQVYGNGKHFVFLHSQNQNIMTPEQLDSIINLYKRKAVRAYNNDDTFTCNRMIKIVHELEGNYDEYLEQEFADDHLELYFDVILPKATAMNSLFFTSDPYDNGDGYEVLEWMEDEEDFEDEDFDFEDNDLDLF